MDIIYRTKVTLTTKYILVYKYNSQSEQSVDIMVAQSSSPLLLNNLSKNNWTHVDLTIRKKIPTSKIGER